MGPRGVGKTNLIQRLQGQPCSETYIPTPQISCSHIRWKQSFSREDTCKVECWDVVDEAFLNPDAFAGGVNLIDASVVDVFQNCQCVVLMYDVRDESNEYLESKIQSIPPHVIILLLGNFADLVSSKETPDRITSLASGALFSGRKVHMLQVSTRTCLNMNKLYYFIGLPFLQAKRESLEQQLKQCYEYETEVTMNLKNNTLKKKQDENKRLDDFLNQ